MTDEDYDNGFDDPPLYPRGKLASMSLADLEKELDRQAGRQGALGDADYIDNYAVMEAEGRCNLVEAEIKRRKAPP